MADPILEAIQKMQDNFKGMENRLNGRIDSLENKLLDQIKQVVGQEMEQFKSEMDTNLEEIRGRINALEQSAVSMNEQVGRDFNIVLTNVEVKENEDVAKEVNDIINKEIGLTEVTIEKAERKVSKKEDVPGVIIATMKSTKDRGEVLKKKAKLKNSTNMSHVRIYPDMSWKERKYENNMRTLVNAVGNETIVWKNGRIIAKQGLTNNPNRNMSGVNAQPTGNNEGAVANNTQGVQRDFGGQRGHGRERGRGQGRGQHNNAPPNTRSRNSNQ